MAAVQSGSWTFNETILITFFIISPFLNYIMDMDNLTSQQIWKNCRVWRLVCSQPNDPKRWLELWIGYRGYRLRVVVSAIEFFNSPQRYCEFDAFFAFAQEGTSCGCEPDGPSERCRTPSFHLLTAPDCAQWMFPALGPILREFNYEKLHDEIHSVRDFFERPWEKRLLFAVDDNLTCAAGSVVPAPIGWIHNVYPELPCAGSYGDLPKILWDEQAAGLRPHEPYAIREDEPRRVWLNNRCYVFLSAIGCNDDAQTAHAKMDACVWFGMLNRIQQWRFDRMVRGYAAVRADGKVVGILRPYIHNAVPIEEKLQQTQDPTLVNRWKDELLRAVRYLHSRNLTWGDVHPTNVLVDENMRIRLISNGPRARAGWAAPWAIHNVSKETLMLSKLINLLFPNSAN